MTSYSGISTTGSVSDVGEANKEAKKLYKRKFLSSSVHIWKSKISWRITLSAFMTILPQAVVCAERGGRVKTQQKAINGTILTSLIKFDV